MSSGKGCAEHSAEGCLKAGEPRHQLHLEGLGGLHSASHIWMWCSDKGSFPGAPSCGLQRMQELEPRAEVWTWGAAGLERSFGTSMRSRGGSCSGLSSTGREVPLRVAKRKCDTWGVCFRSIPLPAGACHSENWHTGGGEVWEGAADVSWDSNWTERKKQMSHRDVLRWQINRLDSESDLRGEVGDSIDPSLECLVSQLIWVSAQDMVARGKCLLQGWLEESRALAISWFHDCQCSSRAPDSLLTPKQKCVPGFVTSFHCPYLNMKTLGPISVLTSLTRFQFCLEQPPLLSHRRH